MFVSMYVSVTLGKLSSETNAVFIIISISTFCLTFDKMEIFARICSSLSEAQSGSRSQSGSGTKQNVLIHQFSILMLSNRN
jgi:hypothetical protein